MHILSFSKIKKYFEENPNSKVALQDWYKKVKRSKWNDFSDIKKTFSSVDSVGNKRFVFNIKGNHYRLIAIVYLEIGRVYIRWIGNHKEYDKIKNIDKL